MLTLNYNVIFEREIYCDLDYYIVSTQYSIFDLVPLSIYLHRQKKILFKSFIIITIITIH